VLHVSNHNSRRVQIELLHSAVRPESEETGARTPESKAFDMLEGWNVVRSDMLRPYIP
jgi:hypothetical protein